LAKAPQDKDAEKGEFSKRTVYIPNYGAWRD